MKNLDILKRHNAYIARQRQRKSSQLSDDEITKNNLEDHEDNINSVSCISHLSVDEIEMQQLKDEKIPLFTSKHVGETDDIISRQTLWLEKKELRIRDTLKKQEEEFLKDLSFNPDFGNNTYSWERVKRQSEREQERFVQRERQRESKRELYRLQEELVSQTALFGGLNTSSVILLSPIDPAVTTTIKKKKKKKLQQQQELSDKDFIANMTNDSQLIYQDYLAPLSAPEMQKTIPITRSKSAEKRHRNNNKNSNNNTSSPAISSPYYSRSQRNLKKQTNANDFADLDEFQIDLKQCNKMGVGVHSITQKDITDAQHWFAKLMRERKDIESSTDEINNDLYEQQQTQIAQTPPPLIPKRKKLKPGHKKKQSSSITKSNNNNSRKVGRKTTNNNQPDTNSSRNDRDSNNSDINQYNQSLQLQYNDESDNINSTIHISETQEGQQQEGIDEEEEDYDEEDEYGDIAFDNNNGMTSFFHESSTAEKGRHQVLEPLAFDSSSITRRVDNQNSYVSFLVGHLRDNNTRKYEIITIVFDKNHFNESTAEKWWLANEQRVRKDIEK